MIKLLKYIKIILKINSFVIFKNTINKFSAVILLLIYKLFKDKNSNYFIY